MNKTLYLCENSRDIRILRDGPSICIRERNRADSRVPARLIGRVVIIGNIGIETSVITLFSESGVPVIFMSRLADEMAFATPSKGSLPAHYLHQRRFHGDKETQLKFIRWAKSLKIALQRNAFKRLYHEIAADIRARVSESDYEELVSYLKPEDAMKWAAVSQFVGMLFKGVAIEELVTAGIDPHPAFLRQEERYGLAADFSDLLQSEIDFQSLEFFASKIANPCGNKQFQSSTLTEHAVKNIVSRFENTRLPTQKLIASLIEDLILMIRGTRI